MCLLLWIRELRLSHMSHMRNESCHTWVMHHVTHDSYEEGVMSHTHESNEEWGISHPSCIQNEACHTWVAWGISRATREWCVISHTNRNLWSLEIRVSQIFFHAYLQNQLSSHSKSDSVSHRFRVTRKLILKIRIKEDLWETDCEWLKIWFWLRGSGVCCSLWPRESGVRCRWLGGSGVCCKRKLCLFVCRMRHVTHESCAEWVMSRWSDASFHV